MEIIVTYNLNEIAAFVTFFPHANINHLLYWSQFTVSFVKQLCDDTSKMNMHQFSILNMMKNEKIMNHLQHFTDLHSLC